MYRLRSGRGRHRTAFFSCVTLMALLALAGCGRSAGVFRGTLQGLLPLPHDVSKRAAQLPYASIDLTIDGQGGLLVLAELSDGNAYFQSASHGVIVIRNGYLSQTAGLPANLLMTRVYRTGESRTL